MERQGRCKKYGGKEGVVKGLENTVKGIKSELDVHSTVDGNTKKKS